MNGNCGMLKDMFQARLKMEPEITEAMKSKKFSKRTILEGQIKRLILTENKQSKVCLENIETSLEGRDLMNKPTTNSKSH